MGTIDWNEKLILNHRGPCPRRAGATFGCAAPGERWQPSQAEGSGGSGLFGFPPRVWVHSCSREEVSEAQEVCSCCRILVLPGAHSRPLLQLLGAGCEAPGTGESRVCGESRRPDIVGEQISAKVEMKPSASKL